MEKDEKLEAIAKALYENLSTPSLVYFENGNAKVIRETESNYNFVVNYKEKDITDLLKKFRELNYSVDLETFKGLGMPVGLLTVDVSNKQIRVPMIVSANHAHYLYKEASILLQDVFDNFDELVVRGNKELAFSLHQCNKSK